MVELTIGSIAVKMLAMAAEAAMKGSIGEAAKDAYGALKRGIASLIGAGDAAALNLKPGSTVAQEIDDLDSEKQASIENLTLALTEALKALKKQPELSGTIGAEFFERVDATEIELRNSKIEGSGSRGLVFRKPAKIGKLSLEGLDVSSSPGKSTR